MNDAPTPAQKIRFAIPTPALHEKAMRLLEKKKFHGLAWVLAEFVRRGESIPSSLLRALLDGDSIEAAEAFLSLVVDQDAIEVAPDLAASLAAQVPRTRDTGILYGLLQVLTLLDAPSHLAAFHAALSSIDLQVQSVALRGITAARRAESEPVLLDFLHGKPEPPQAAKALAALLVLGSEEAVAKAVRLVLDLAALEESTDEDPDWLAEFDDALGPDGYGIFSFTRVEEVVGLHVHEDMLSVLNAFFPTADSAAARRAAAVFTPERRQELKEVLEGKDLFILTEYLAECGIEAAALASADEPRFVSMGGRISAFLEAVLDAPGLHQAVEVQGDVIPIICGMLLAKAIRGRETLVEYRECGRDPERLAGLLAVDEAWIDASRFREIAATLREGGPALEACRKTAQTHDPFASGNCKFLLAALEPDDRIGEAALDFDFDRDDGLNLVSAAVKVGGDAYCQGVLKGLEEDRFSSLTWFPGMVLDSLRSETASSALERHWDGIAEHTEARVFLRLVAWTGKAAMAEKAIESLRTGELDLANALEDEHARDDLRLALEAFRELTGVRFDRVGVLRSALAAYKRLHPSAPDADDEDEDEEFEDETEDETESREGDEAPRHRHGGHESGVCHCCGEPYGPESFTEASVSPPGLESLLDRGAFLVPPEYGEILEPARDSPSMRPDTIYEDDPEDTAPVEPVVREEPKVGRNDPCPCGSGKKFKKCCGK